MWERGGEEKVETAEEIKSIEGERRKMEGRRKA